MRLPYRPTTILCSALLLSSPLACSDDGGSEVGDEAETGTTGDTSTAGTEGETGESGSSSSTDDAETTISTVDESPDDADSDAETLDETTDADTSETKADETTDTGNLGCGEIDTLEACQAAAGCQPVEGQPLVGGGLGSSPCLEASEFLGCIPQQICDDALTWFCMGNDSMYLVSNGCGPDGFDICQGPPNIPMDCK